MRVLVFETDHGGHRLHYVRHIILALREISQQVTVALTSIAPASKEFATHLSDVAEQVQIDAWIPRLPGGVIRNALHRAGTLRESIARARAEWLYVPGADSIGQILGVRRSMMLPSLPRGLPAEGLMLRGGFAYPQQSIGRGFSARVSWAAACRAPWTCMHILDPLAYEPTVRRAGSSAARYRLMADPVELPEPVDPQTARARLGIPLDGRYLGCVGLINGRKGTDLLIRAFAEGGFRQNDRLLLAGPQEAEIRQLLQGSMARLIAERRIICIDEMLSVDKLTDAISAMDLICVLYPHHIGSVSIAIRAAAAHRPVLAHSFGWLKEMVPRFDLGTLCDATNHSELPQAIRSALDGAERFAPTENARRYVQFNSVRNFRACWTSEIRRHLGLQQAPEHQPWESVSERLTT